MVILVSRCEFENYTKQVHILYLKKNRKFGIILRNTRVKHESVRAEKGELVLMSDNMEKRTESLPMLALRGLVLFPEMVLHFDVGREKSILALNEVMSNGRKIYLVAQKDMRDDDPTPEQLYPVGVVAEVRQIVRTQADNLRVLVEGKYRARTIEVTNDQPYFNAVVEEYPLRKVRSSKEALCEALVRTVKDQFEEYCYLAPKMPKELILNVMVSDNPVYLCEYIAGNIPIRVEDKQLILMESSVSKRLELLSKILESENDILSLEREIQEKVKDQMDRNQREYYLREQMRAISNELGDGDSPEDDALTYQEQILALKLSDEVAEKFLKEADRLSKMPSNSQEANVIRNYLDTCLELPWNTATKDKIDIARAQKILDRDHYGLKQVKDRILELLAVRKLAPDIKGQIICLVGPPGVGKTSIAKSIAKAMGRKYVRLSLGGVRDESDIRGHRKTYIGAMPGRIMNAISLAKSKNPLMLLDEVDKLGNDFRGDPSAALLEVLDSEQNNTFRDHYIEVPFDLSEVLFIATANSLDTIPVPLLDRMEIINLSSYTREEKFHIAKEHLVAKQVKRHGLTGRTFTIQDGAIYELIDNYTREAGVRTLERMLGALCRKAAKGLVAGEYKKAVITTENITKFLGPKKYKREEVEQKNQIGVVNGLAWTSVGGELLQVEVAVLDGNGKLELTGSLGDVMKESAHAAVSYIRSCYDRYGIDKEFYKNKDIHIHVPEGAVPKDGPSAGVTICTAVLSALSQTPVKHDVAMTGEITLRGRVLPIGGLKEKSIAAYRAGIKTILIPKENEPDLAEIDDEVRQGVTFIPAETVDTVLSSALERLPQHPPEQLPMMQISTQKETGRGTRIPQ